MRGCGDAAAKNGQPSQSNLSRLRGPAISIAAMGQRAQDGEAARLFALHRSDVLDTPPEPPFDDLAELASQLCDDPFAAINFIDETRLFLKAKIGLPLCGRELPREDSFCGRLLYEEGGILVVPDAHADPRFSHLSLVREAPHIRFYAGVCLVMPDGTIPGVLCVLDQRPRALTPLQTTALEGLGRQVVRQLVSRRTNDLLRRRESELRLIVESTGDAIYGLDNQGRCTFVNPACLRALGYRNAESLLGKNMHALVHHTREDGTSYPEDQCTIARAFRDGRDIRIEDEVLWRADGTPFPVIYTSCPLRHGDETIGAVVTFVDITEQRRLQKELATNAHVRDRFAAILGHDLRNPLAAVLMGSKLIANGADTPPRARVLAKRVHCAAERMNRLIADLLDVIRVRSGDALPMAPTVVDLGCVVQHVVSEIEMAHPTLRIEMDVADGGVLGQWDSDRVAQMCSNLVANAVAHGDPREPIRVEVRQSPEFATMTVSNGGPPIPSALLPHVFEVFRKGLAASREHRERGLGLGLFICRQIALAHGGDIAVRSDSRETAFTVRLPRGGVGNFDVGQARALSSLASL